MTKKKYLEDRKKLMDEAQQLITDGKVEDADAKMKEVEALDDKWDEIATAQANFNALNKDPVALTPFNVEDAFGTNPKVTDAAAQWESEDYAKAWAKHVTNQSLTHDEQKVFDIVNEAFTHTTSNTDSVIPKTVSKGIWDIAAEEYPYFGDVAKTYVNGVLTVIKADISSEAAWYEEDVETADGKETFKTMTLAGCELARSISISWKLKEMAIDEFLPYITRKLGEKMGAAAGYGVTHGKGASSTDGTASEPMGVVTALKAEEDTPQVIKYTDVPTYENIVSARAKIASGCAKLLKVYANTNTVWTKLAMIVDKNGRPIFISDAREGGAPRLLGMEVKEDGSMNDGEILISHAGKGYHLNINKEVSMTAEDHAKKRITDICAYAIMDGAPTTTKAHALLEVSTEAAG